MYIYRERVGLGETKKKENGVVPIGALPGFDSFQDIISHAHSLKHSFSSHLNISLFFSHYTNSSQFFFSLFPLSFSSIFSFDLAEFVEI